MKFQTGNRVRAVKNGWADVQPGDTGHVLYTFDPKQVAVEWDRCVGGHTASMYGRPGRMGYCTFEPAHYLELLPETEEVDRGFGSELEDLL